MQRASHSRLSAGSPLVLGSSSPRRREILSQMGVPLLVLPADVDERTQGHESPDAYIERIVAAKHAAVLERSREQGILVEGQLVADTLVTIDGQILGKPNDLEHAVHLLTLLNGRTHEVLTRYCLAARGQMLVRTVRSEVEFRRLSPSELLGYAESGEGSDKAGSYALQGRGAALVRAVRGSVSSVIGLPAAEVSEDLAALGLWETFG